MLLSQKVIVTLPKSSCALTLLFPTEENSCFHQIFATYSARRGFRPIVGSFLFVLLIFACGGSVTGVDSFKVYFQIPGLFELLSTLTAANWTYLSMKGFVLFKICCSFETLSTDFTTVLLLVIMSFAMFNKIACLGEKLLADNANKRFLSVMVPLVCFQMA